MTSRHQAPRQFRFHGQTSAMIISCVIQRIFKRLDDTRFRAPLASNEDRTSIRKSATISSW